MTLARQLQVLVEEAPRYGVAPLAMEKAIAPVFGVIAEQLGHLEYYVLQNMEEDWIISVISDRQATTIEKKVIYGFVSVKDAKTFNSPQKSNAIAISMPIVQILFRLFSLEQIDSIIFFDKAGSFHTGVEVKRRDLQRLVEQQILQLKNVPPDLA